MKKFSRRTDWKRFSLLRRSTESNYFSSRRNMENVNDSRHDTRKTPRKFLFDCRSVWEKTKKIRRNCLKSGLDVKMFSRTKKKTNGSLFVPQQRISIWRKEYLSKVRLWLRWFFSSLTRNPTKLWPSRNILCSFGSPILLLDGRPDRQSSERVCSRIGRKGQILFGFVRFSPFLTLKPVSQSDKKNNWQAKSCFLFFPLSDDCLCEKMLIFREKTNFLLRFLFEPRFSFVESHRNSDERSNSAESLADAANSRLISIFLRWNFR